MDPTHVGDGVTVVCAKLLQSDWRTVKAGLTSVEVPATLIC